MRPLQPLILLVLLVLASWSMAVHLVVPMDNWYTTGGLPSGGTGRECEIVSQWGVQDTIRYDYNSTTEVTFSFDFRDNQGRAAVGVKNMIDWALEGHTFVTGNPLSEVSAATGRVASVYGVAQLAQSSTSHIFSDKSVYPYFTRMWFTSPDYVASQVAWIMKMIEEQGMGWSKVAIISTTDRFGISLSEQFIKQTKNLPITVLTYQTFLLDATDTTVEMREIKNSGARVILAYCVTNYRTPLNEAKRIGLLDDSHVFIGGPSVTGLQSTYQFRNNSLDLETVENLRGHLGIQTAINREGVRYERMLEQWLAADPSKLPYSGPGTTPGTFPALAYDMGVIIAHTVMKAHREGLLTEDRVPTAEEWFRTVNSVDFFGASGPVAFDNKGDRDMDMSLYNWRPEQVKWVPVATISETGVITMNENETIIWRDNTTNPPDLLLAPGYNYWSCHDRKMKFDETGHAVHLHTPGSRDVDDIDEDYVCDHFIDCWNLSDESHDCAGNYTALFIAFGIITGLLILATCCLIPFVIVFGFIKKRRRVKASSPFFLLIIILSCLLGFVSEFAWYGKPHPVACGFRPWLLGLAVVSMISALSAKTWRLWRIFKSSYVTERISDLQLLILYLLMVLPAVVILIVWTIVSTPTADIERRQDADHYVCTTGGFTGKPGGLIFFFILVGYEALVLLFAAFLSIVTRNVPSFFNESKLIAISIYNLGFLAAVVIPVVMVLESINPFAAWIIRSVAVLYAFTATLLLQFASKVVGVILIDRGRDIALPKLGKTNSSSSTDFQTVSASVSR